MTNRIDRTLEALRAEGRSALAPFVTIGYPDLKTSEEMAKSILESGADMLELGIPFSDPLADGPTVQVTSFRALENGTTLRGALESLRNLRANGITSPLIFSYGNAPVALHLIDPFSNSTNAGMPCT